MIRYLLTAVGALALVSNVAFAETGTYRHSTTKVMTRSAPAGMMHKKVIIKRHGDRRYGALIAKKKIVREGMSGSSVSRTRMIAPGAGGTVVKKRTVIRR